MKSRTNYGPHFLFISILLIFIDGLFRYFCPPLKGLLGLVGKFRSLSGLNQFDYICLVYLEKSLLITWLLIFLCFCGVVFCYLPKKFKYFPIVLGLCSILGVGIYFTVNSPAYQRTKESIKYKLREKSSQAKAEKRIILRSENLKKAAKKGDLKAQYHLSLAYYWGINVKKSEKNFLNWFRQASLKGHNPKERAFCHKDAFKNKKTYQQSRNQIPCEKVFHSYFAKNVKNYENIEKEIIFENDDYVRMLIQLNWQDAGLACTKIKGSWRLPSSEEMVLLRPKVEPFGQRACYNPGPTPRVVNKEIRSKPLCGVGNKEDKFLCTKDRVWTSDPSEDFNQHYQYVDLFSGRIGNQDRSDPLVVICVPEK